jgi:peptidoglycan L-alanyl-D-glutamate endopeptidase CwlK
MAVSISGSVGRGADNRRADVREIQRLLNDFYTQTPLVVDGVVGRSTIARIERFQRRFMANPDGRIDPDGSTLKRLRSVLPARGADWSEDSSKWPQEKKLSSLDHRFRPGVENVLRSLGKGGFKPVVFFAWRSIAVQAELLRRGVTRVSFSFHNAQTRSGTPSACAADSIDRRWAWERPAETNGFWSALGEAALGEGLYWGGSWPKFKDEAHVQYYPSTRLAEVRRESGLV